MDHDLPRGEHFVLRKLTPGGQRDHPHGARRQRRERRSRHGARRGDLRRGGRAPLGRAPYLVGDASRQRTSRSRRWGRRRCGPRTTARGMPTLEEAPQAMRARGGAPARDAGRPVRPAHVRGGEGSGCAEADGMRRQLTLTYGGLAALFVIGVVVQGLPRRPRDLRRQDLQPAQGLRLDPAHDTLVIFLLAIAGPRTRRDIGMGFGLALLTTMLIHSLWATASAEDAPGSAALQPGAWASSCWAWPPDRWQTLGPRSRPRVFCRPVRFDHEDQRRVRRESGDGLWSP